MANYDQKNVNLPILVPSRIPCCNFLPSRPAPLSRATFLCSLSLASCFKIPVLFFGFIGLDSRSHSCLFASIRGFARWDFGLPSTAPNCTRIRDFCTYVHSRAVECTLVRPGKTKKFKMVHKPHITGAAQFWKKALQVRPGRPSYPREYRTTRLYAEPRRRGLPRSHSGAGILLRIPAHRSLWRGHVRRAGRNAVGDS